MSTLATPRSPTSLVYHKIEWIITSPIQPYGGSTSLARELTQAQPAGIIAILIGLARAEGHVLARAASGGTVALVGLYKPTLERLSAAGSAELEMLRSVLVPGGGLALRQGDGSVRSLEATGTSPRELKWGDIVLQSSDAALKWGDVVLKAETVHLF